MAQACHQLEETFLHAYVDGEFDAEENAEVQAHLVSCAVCTHAVRIHESYKAAMSRASAVAPHKLHDTLRERLADEVPEGRWLSAFRDPRGIALTAACVGACAWFLAGGMTHPIVGVQQSSLVDDGVALHARSLPLDYAASDVGSLQQWLSSRLDFGVRVPQFEQRARVQGVRLSTLHARPAAMVTYAVTQDGRRVSLLIVDDPEPHLGGAARHLQGRDVYLSRARGFNVVSWRRDEVVYSLISDLDERDVLQLVQSAEQR
jgi:anti-sigma factor RsiW